MVPGKHATEGYCVLREVGREFYCSFLLFACCPCVHEFLQCVAVLQMHRETVFIKFLLYQNLLAPLPAGLHSHLLLSLQSLQPMAWPFGCLLILLSIDAM